MGVIIEIKGRYFMGILDKVSRYREEEEKLRWEGTFGEYLEL